MPSQTAEQAIEAYGGEARWRASTTLRATVSAFGLAFMLKLQPPFREMPVEMDVWRPRVRIAPQGWRGVMGELDGQTVRLISADGRELARRDEAYRYFPYGRRLLWWDRLDQTYFSGYALWNYLCLPALLLRDDIRWTEAGPGVLEGRFPPPLPTHSPVQRWHFDPASGLLRRHDYTARVFGDWAQAANVVLEHRTWNGIPFPSRRRVTPLLLGRPAPFPLLVGIRFHEVTLVTQPCGGVLE